MREAFVYLLGKESIDRSQATKFSLIICSFSLSTLSVNIILKNQSRQRMMGLSRRKGIRQVFVPQEPFSFIKPYLIQDFKFSRQSNFSEPSSKYNDEANFLFGKRIFSNLSFEIRQLTNFLQSPSPDIRIILEKC